MEVSSLASSGKTTPVNNFRHKCVSKAIALAFPLLLQMATHKLVDKLGNSGPLVEREPASIFYQDGASALQ